MKQRIFAILVPVLGLCAPLSAQVTELNLGVPIADSIGAGRQIAEPLHYVFIGGTS